MLSFCMYSVGDKKKRLTTNPQYMSICLSYCHRAIRMRMYAKNKMEAQKQLEDPSCTIIRLALDIECRLVAR